MKNLSSLDLVQIGKKIVKAFLHISIGMLFLFRILKREHDKHKVKVEN